MITENLSTLKINKLSKAQYERELATGNIDESALYLTPDEAIAFPVDSVNGKTGAVNLSASDVGAASNEHNHIISDITNLQTALDDKVSSSALNNYYTKTEIDEMDFGSFDNDTVLITVEDIDAICGTSIQVATVSEVFF